MHFVFLGSSGALPGRNRDTTSLVFVGPRDAVLVDCGGSPAQKLMLAGTDPLALSRVVITHIHPDHAYGLPSLVQTLFLLGRKTPLHLACREEHEAPLRALLSLFGLLERPGLFPLVWEPVPPREGFAISKPGDFALTASPNAHGGMPNMALRVEAPAGPPSSTPPTPSPAPPLKRSRAAPTRSSTTRRSQSGGRAASARTPRPPRPGRSRLGRA